MYLKSILMENKYFSCIMSNQTNNVFKLIVPLGTNFIEIAIEISTHTSKKAFENVICICWPLFEAPVC